MYQILVLLQQCPEEDFPVAGDSTPSSTPVQLPSTTAPTSPPPSTYPSFAPLQSPTPTLPVTPSTANSAVKIETTLSELLQDPKGDAFSTPTNMTVQPSNTTAFTSPPPSPSSRSTPVKPTSPVTPLITPLNVGSADFEPETSPVPDLKCDASSDRVDQQLQLPVVFNKEHFDIFNHRRPPPSAECEICMEKVIAVDEKDVEFLKTSCQHLDQSNNGYIDVEDMKSILAQLKTIKPNMDIAYLAKSIVSENGLMDYNQFLDTYVTIQLDCCRVLCVCLPSRWIHNPCLMRKIALGVNGCIDYLLQCGCCRTSVWGPRYEQWMVESRRLLDCAIVLEREERREHARKAYKLVVNVINVVVRCGSGGLKHNVLLGVCLSFVGTAIYLLQSINARSEPCDLLAGNICLMGMRLGGPPTIYNALILSQMCRVQSVAGNNKDKVSWLDLANKCLTGAEGSVPLEATAFHMDAACMRLRIRVLHGAKLEDVTKMLENKTIWPWGIDELTVPTLFAICGIVGQSYGIGHAAKYVRRGLSLDPLKFDRLRQGLERQIQSDFVYVHNCLAHSELTNDEYIFLGEFWMWEKTMLDATVRKQISGAYRTKGFVEKAAEWCDFGVAKNETFE